jgi:hypothetical protein
METQVMRQLPRYKCHKEVWALKIKSIAFTLGRPNSEGIANIIEPEEEGYAPFPVSDEYVNKHNPQVGGYWVLYDDGYQSYSPAKAFEEGYSRV